MLQDFEGCCRWLRARLKDDATIVLLHPSSGAGQCSQRDIFSQHLDIGCLRGIASSKAFDSSVTLAALAAAQIIKNNDTKAPMRCVALPFSRRVHTRQTHWKDCGFACCQQTFALSCEWCRRTHAAVGAVDRIISIYCRLYQRFRRHQACAVALCDKC